MRKIYLLTVAYEIDRFLKREESLQVKYMWIPIFPSKPYSVDDSGILHGQPFKIFVTKNTKKIYLYLSIRDIDEESQTKEKAPPKLIKAFSVEKKDSLKTELVIQFLQRGDEILLPRLLNDDANIKLLLNGNLRCEALELPAESPQIPVPRFKPMRFIWILDGTLSQDAFYKCANTAIILTDLVGEKTDLEAEFICFGEYQTQLSRNFITISQGSYAIKKGIKTDDIRKFKDGIRGLEPIQNSNYDDPAACLELALKELVSDLENQNEIKPVWVFVLGNSLPHYTIADLQEKDVHIIPTEEFENIDWKIELEKLRKMENIHLQAIWVDDRNNASKWTETDSEGNKIGLQEAKAWWKNSFSFTHKSIEFESELNASSISSLLYDLIWYQHPPKMEILTPSIYPLWKSLEQLEVYRD